MMVYLSLDSKGYTEKPIENIGYIKKRSSQNWKKIDIRDAADLIGNRGYTFVPSKLVGGIKEENFAGIQVFALDFDGGVTFKEVQDICKRYDIKMSFAYSTMSSTSEREKFRVVFTYDCLITEAFVAKIILAILCKIFPQADRQCKNLDRMFYGGKKLLCLDENARVGMVHLIQPLMDRLNEGGNFNRNCRNFCKNNDLRRKNELPMIIPTKYLSDFDENVTSNNIYNIGECTFPSFSIIKGFAPKDSTRKIKSIKYNLEITENSFCELINSFVKGEHVDHAGKFAIITNLLHIRGGLTQFYDILEENYPESYDKWYKALRYIKGYKPQRCSEDFCPYYEECQNDGNIIGKLRTDRKVFVEEEKYYSLEEARDQVKINIIDAIEHGINGINLIKAQTAIGKTHTYVDLICNCNEKFIIAVPTNKLKKEVTERIRVRGVPSEDLFMTESIDNLGLIDEDVRKEIQKYHSMGLHNKTKDVLSEFIKNIKNNPERCNEKATLEICEKIIKGLDNVESRIIVTTHAYLKTLNEKIFIDRTVIVDEDILMLNFFSNINQISTDVLRKIAVADKYTYSAKAQEMLKAPLGQVINVTPYRPTPEEAEKIISFIGSYEGENIGDLVAADTFIRYEDYYTGKEFVRYFCATKLKPNVKYIILSATLNENIYNLYFKDEIKIKTYPEKKAAYKGKIIQYTHESLSRTSLSKNLEVFDFACNLANNKRLPFITFKTFRDKLSKTTDFCFTELNFGNTSGIDKYKGKDLGIVGTFYKTPEEYKLIGAYLDGNANDDENRVPKVRRVKYNKKSFLINTYKDPIIQELQLYQIESEMEQSVGRARLLNEDCTVYLFSSFPCEQAELHMDDYLKENRQNCTVE